ncbi:MAG: SDR family NAD(P)-dependent oxidoreductase [Bacteroidales bacterium]
MKNAIIVGSTSGIGLELARLLAAEGVRTGITGRREECFTELKSECPGLFFFKKLDARDTGSSIEALDQLAAEMGGLDLLVYSAGTGELNPDLEFGPERNTIDTNVSGFTAIACWAFKYFKRQGSGQVAAISSIGGLRGGRAAPSYNASKAYQINYLEGLRQKASREKLNIVITDIRPGLVDTAMAKGDGLFWVMPVKKAALQIFRAIKSKKRVVHVTRRWHLIAILLRILPRVVHERM